MNRSYIHYLPAVVFDDRQLPASCKLLFALVSSLTEDKGYCWASNEYLGQKMDADKDTVSGWVSKIVKRGYFVVSFQDEISKQGRRIYLNDQYVARFIAENAGKHPYDGESYPPTIKIVPPYDKNRTPPTIKIVTDTIDNLNLEKETIIYKGDSSISDFNGDESETHQPKGQKENTPPSSASPPRSLPIGTVVYGSPEIPYNQQNYIQLEQGLGQTLIIPESEFLGYLKQHYPDLIYGFAQNYKTDVEKAIKRFFLKNHIVRFERWQHVHFALLKHFSNRGETTSRKEEPTANAKQTPKSNDKDKELAANRFKLDKTKVKQ